MSTAASSAPPAVPGFFGPFERPLFGWLHPGDCAEPRLGVVVCSPLGYENLCCHRTLRRIAELFAGHGVPAVRFDYDGTWDSAGSDLDPARVSAWTSSVEAAIDALRSATGVDRICLVGIRFGATLAALAAQRRTDVAAIIAIAPVVDGRRYARELRALAATSAVDAYTNGGDHQEAAGFTMTSQTRDALAALGPANLVPRTKTQFLILERDDLPADERWPSALGDAGMPVTRERFDGFAQMMFDAHDAKVPQMALQRALEWLLLVRDGAPSASSDDGTRRSCDPRRVFRARADLPGQLTEEVLQPGGKPRGFAIASMPGSSSGSQGRPLLMLLNSGAVHHVGPYRLFVGLARQLAASGVTVVRYDLPAIGDGDADPERLDDAPYPATAVEDIHRALADLVKRFAPSEIHFGGVCAGAYHSLKAAQKGLVARSIVVVNPLTFFWKPGLPLDAREFQVTAEAARYQRTLFEPAAWIKLLRGEVEVRPILRTFTRRLGTRLHHIVRELKRALGWQLEDDLAAELRVIAQRGTRVEFLFSENEPGLAMLREQGGRTVGRLERHGVLTIETIAGADHTFSTLAPREHLMTLVEHRICSVGSQAS